jgi:ubiquinone/menaquinone biosynthesis C-methylase UbiE
MSDLGAAPIVNPTFPGDPNFFRDRLPVESNLLMTTLEQIAELRRKCLWSAASLEGKFMSLEHQVAAHYTKGTLQDKILSALRNAGKDIDRISADDLALLDNFHVGGREATEALADVMGVRPEMHLLDVGCGIGGPARYFAQRGCQVTGIDLSEEFIQVAESLTRVLKLDAKLVFHRASALEIPFTAATLDGAYMIHVGMNIADKSGVFGEVGRVLKPGGQFAIFDIMRAGNEPLEFPMPWAATPETSFVASAPEYRDALEAAGFRIVHQRSRRPFAIEFIQKMAAQSGKGPVLGVHLLMGEQAPAMLKNVNGAIMSGTLDPVEIVAVEK